MTLPDNSNHREPSLSGEHAPHSSRDEPSLSLDRLLPGLREALDSQDRGKRLTTLEQLRSSNAVTVVPLLLELLETATDTKTKQRCIATLGQLRDERALSALIKLLDDDDEGVRKVSAWALGEIGSAGAVQPLLRLVEREAYSRIVSSAVASLGQLGDLVALPMLFALSKNAEEENGLNLAADAAIKLLGRSCKLSQLIQYLTHNDEVIRHWAADRFVHHREVPQIEHFPLLKGLIESEQRSDVAQRAVHLVSHLDDPQTEMYLLDLLTNSDDRLRAAAIRAISRKSLGTALPRLIERYEIETENNRSEIIEAVAVINDPRVVPFLLDIIESDDDRWRATSALQSRNEPEAGRLLLDRLNNATEASRVPIIHALDYFPSAEVTTVLLELVHQSNDDDERREAIESLHPDLFPELIPHLITLLYDDPSDTIRNRAIWTLCRAFDDQIERELRTFLAQTDSDEMRADALSALLNRDVADAQELLLEQWERIKDEEALKYLIYQLRILDADTQFAMMQRLYSNAQSASLRAEIIDESAHLLSSETVQFVIEALQHDSSPWVRANAAWTLSYVAWTNAEALGALIAALNDNSVVEEEHSSSAQRICDIAAQCLERMTDIPEAQAALTNWRAPNEHGDPPVQ